MSNPITNRYDFVVFFDVENGNPNGDPDAGNMPRIDPETGYGVVTDVCLKRKIRNYVETVKEGEPGFEIYIKEGVPLNVSDRRAYEELGIDPKETKKLKKDNPQLDVQLRDCMCKAFYDIRTFGAVMTTFVKDNLNCGQVRGPVQLTFSRSVDPIIPQEVTITRVAITKEDDAAKKDTGSMWFPTACIVAKGSFPRTWPAKPLVSRKKILSFSGAPSSTCSSMTIPLLAARWPFAPLSCSSMSPNSVMRLRISCSML